MVLASLADVAALYAARGGATYGEDVTQIDHAEQCAALAAANGSPPAVIAAALLHDIGHLLGDQVDGDAGHAAAGAAALAGLFGAEVCAPIALHVAAKRFLCLVEPAYGAGLSPASHRSLALQGGPFTAADAAAFQRDPHWAAAITLRRIDDSGKRDPTTIRSFASYLPLLAAQVRAGRRP